MVLGLDAVAAAKVLDKKPGAVRMAAHRGLRRLAERLRPTTRLTVAVVTLSDDYRPRHADQGDMNAARPPTPRPGRDQDAGPVVPTAGGGEPGSMLDDIMIERLLRGATPEHPDAWPLRRLLDAASAPGTADEMTRMGEIATAFAARPRHRRGFAARLLGVKAAAVLVAATATGGLALAAGTGVLPTPLHPRPAASHPRTPDRPSIGTTESRPPSPLPSGSTGTPLAVLCAEYAALSPSQREKALEAPAYAALKATAGTADRTKAYCETLPVATPPAPEAVPAHHPTGKPSTTGKPTAHPSHPTTDRKTH